MECRRDMKGFISRVIQWLALPMVAVRVEKGGIQGSNPLVEDT